MTKAFATEIAENDGVLSGPWRQPKQMLHAQTYDSHASIHDDATARKLGFQGGTIEGNRLATRTLLLSLFASVVLSVATIAWPLYSRARPGGRVGTSLYAALAYFGLIGVGFMLAEVGLLMRLSLVLGHPSYSLIVVLSSLVASAGLGSYLSDRLPMDERPLCFVYPVVIAALMLALAAYLPDLAPRVQVLETRARIAIAGGLTSVMGLAMGFAFPTGMRLVQRRQVEETPWLWGINGIGGVLASSVAVVVALEAGLRSLFVVAAACYLALLPLVSVLVRAGRAAADEDRARVADAPREEAPDEPTERP